MLHWLLDIFLIVCLFLFMIDKLTFLWVRRCYDLFYHLMVRTGGHLIFIDIDDFRKFNNQYGHRIGDKVLRGIGLILQKESYLRAFRYGGDEFAILLPWASEEYALQLARRVKAKVEEANIEGLGVTITCAVARYEQVAQKLLHEAKESGKNRVIVKVELES